MTPASRGTDDPGVRWLNVSISPMTEREWKNRLRGSRLRALQYGQHLWHARLGLSSVGSLCEFDPVVLIKVKRFSQQHSFRIGFSHSPSCSGKSSPSRPRAGASGIRRRDCAAACRAGTSFLCSAQSERTYLMTNVCSRSRPGLRASLRSMASRYGLRRRPRNRRSSERASSTRPVRALGCPASAASPHAGGARNRCCRQAPCPLPRRSRRDCFHGSFPTRAVGLFPPEARGSMLAFDPLA